MISTAGARCYRSQRSLRGFRYTYPPAPFSPSTGLLVDFEYATGSPDSTTESKAPAGLLADFDAHMNKVPI